MTCAQKLKTYGLKKFKPGYAFAKLNDFHIVFHGEKIY
jgi:hypothetical protein